MLKASVPKTRVGFGTKTGAVADVAAGVEARAQGLADTGAG